MGQRLGHPSGSAHYFLACKVAVLFQMVPFRSGCCVSFYLEAFGRLDVPDPSLVAIDC